MRRTSAGAFQAEAISPIRQAATPHVGALYAILAHRGEKTNGALTGRAARFRASDRRDLQMADLVYIAITLAFFALAALAVRGCERL